MRAEHELNSEQEKKKKEEKAFFCSCFNHRGEFWTQIKRYPFEMNVFAACSTPLFPLISAINPGKFVLKHFAAVCVSAVPLTVDL